jgi:hypothetical protein
MSEPGKADHVNVLARPFFNYRTKLTIMEAMIIRAMAMKMTC